MGLKLYELPAIWKHIQLAIDDAEGEMSSEVEADLDCLQADLEGKTRGICSLMRQMDAEADACLKEAVRLQAMASARQNNARRLRDYLLNILTAMDTQRVDAGTFKVSVCKNSRPSISWGRDFLELPAEFIRFTPSVDTQKAYEQWKAGEKLPDGFAVKQGHHLRIS